MAKKNGTTAAQALESIVKKAITDSKVKKEIFDQFHCIHCGSKNPAPWIKERKGKKDPYPLAISSDAVAFLNAAPIVPVAKVGDPPVKQIVEGEPKKDANKAVRCCIDWAIKNYGAVADGVPKPE